MQQRYTSSFWRRAYLNLLHPPGEHGPHEDTDQRHLIESACNAPDCMVCSCITASMEDGLVYIPSSELSEAMLKVFVQQYTDLCCLFPVIDPSPLQNQAARFWKSCSFGYVSRINQDMLVVPANPTNMLILLVLTIVRLSSRDIKRPLMMCKAPGGIFFVAAMFILQRVSAKNRSDTAVLQANLAAVVIYSLVGDVRIAKENLQHLHCKRDARLQQMHMSRGYTHVESSPQWQWESWTHYAASMLEDDLLESVEVQSISWPLIKDCLHTIDVQPKSGYILCTVKDFDRVTTDVETLSKQHGHILRNHYDGVQTLLKLRNALPEWLRWEDAGSLPSEISRVFLLLKFYHNIICIAYPAIEELLLSQNPVDKRTLLGRTQKCAFLAAQRLLEIDRHLGDRFVLSRTRRVWAPIWHSIVSFTPERNRGTPSTEGTLSIASGSPCPFHCDQHISQHDERPEEPTGSGASSSVRPT